MKTNFARRWFAIPFGAFCAAACPAAFGWTEIEEGLTAAKEALNKSPRGFWSTDWPSRKS